MNLNGDLVPSHAGKFGADKGVLSVLIEVDGEAPDGASLKRSSVKKAGKLALEA